MDQLSMVRLLSPEVNRFDLDVRILDHSWNYRGSRVQPVPDFPIRVNHHPDLRGQQFKRDIAAAGARYGQEGDIDTALQIFEAALGLWPGDMDFLRFIVVSHLKADDFENARNWLNVMLEQFPGHPWATSGLESLPGKQDAS